MLWKGEALIWTSGIRRSAKLDLSEWGGNVTIPRFTSRTLKEIHESLRVTCLDVEGGVRDEEALYHCTEVAPYSIPSIIIERKPFRMGNLRLAYIVYRSMHERRTDFSQLIQQEQRFLGILKKLEGNIEKKR